jgi:hypothetical protein
MVSGLILGTDSVYWILRLHGTHAGVKMFTEFHLQRTSNITACSATWQTSWLGETDRMCLEESMNLISCSA